MPEKFESLVEEISEMSVTDLAELVEILEDKFGVSAQAPVAVPAAAPAGGEEQGGEEEQKGSYDIELSEVGENKIDVIKIVRDIAEMGLKDAKAMVDDAPKVVLDDVDREQAEEIKEKFEEAGASVNLK
ncbi:50S ribosomal protein L7/L12 [candidate division MSBL1 archaeon SCGC-AAA382N08]|uniref:50S ribosomal protein L7/L12 n=1 Tax=candidate division MSBL1 archaeon SCGC-AAA382N08 TaxID=1698285 RepID=A0A133VNS9_9EURY|nr:50S ribosomal protein L7/L12 [candidate division MSBL1 archaeon SCGC-AAA382N08]